MSAKPDVNALRQFFNDLRCPGIVSLIDFFDSPEGSGVTHLNACTKEGLEMILNNPDYSDAEKNFYATSLNFGCIRGSVTPMQSIANLAQYIIAMPSAWCQQLDEYCAEIVWVITQATKRDVTQEPL